jgi:hypothetical protein
MLSGICINAHNSIKDKIRRQKKTTNKWRAHGLQHQWILMKTHLSFSIMVKNP